MLRKITVNNFACVGKKRSKIIFDKCLVIQKYRETLVEGNIYVTQIVFVL